MNYGKPLWISFIDADDKTGQTFITINARVIFGWNRERITDGRGGLQMTANTVIFLANTQCIVTSESFESVTVKISGLDFTQEIGKLEE